MRKVVITEYDDGEITTEFFEKEEEDWIESKKPIMEFSRLMGSQMTMKLVRKGSNVLRGKIPQRRK